ASPYKAMARSKGYQWNPLKAAATAVTIFTVVSTVFFIYQDSQSLYDRKQQSIPVIVAWTRFFSGDLKTQLLPTLKGCFYKCHFIERHEQKLFQQDASAYVLHGRDINMSDLPPATPRQLKVLMLMESPYHTGSPIHQVPPNYFNATMTYRRDSRYFFPYGQFVNLSSKDIGRNSGAVYKKKVRSMLKRKTRGALIFVSNCQTPSKRERVIKELGQYTEVTVRGGCENQLSFGNGTRRFSCKRDCDDDALIATHRFYISFENSLCNDYITEKFYRRISELLVPVVMRRRFYEGTDVPPGSFIALDDFESTKHLGDYLNFLRRNDTAYLKYFEWTKQYQLPTNYTSNALCKLCEDIYHKESLEVDNIVQYYINNQCLDVR
ncbi:hypothetical protein V3C99_009013, partial [Haemonchus contortus]